VKMKKGQLSLEFLIYLSLAGLSLLFATGVFSSAAQNLRNSMGYYAISVFTSTINDALLSGSSLNFSGFLPHGICNSSFSAETLSTNYGKFSLIGEIDIAQNTFCPDGQIGKFNIQYASGKAELLRVG